MIRNLVPVSTASGLQTARSSRATVRAPVLTRRSALPHRPVLRSFMPCCLREHPAGPASDTRSSRRRRPPQYAIVSSADPLITDIWRTGSGQSKRFDEPLAVADGDGIRRHPARTANTKAPAPALPSSPPGLPRLARRAAVIRNRGEHDLEGQATAAPGARRPVIAQDPLSPFSRRRSASARRAAPATQGNRTHKD